MSLKKVDFNAIFWKVEIDLNRYLPKGELLSCIKRAAANVGIDDLIHREFAPNTIGALGGHILVRQRQYDTASRTGKDYQVDLGYCTLPPTVSSFSINPRVFSSSHARAFAEELEKQGLRPSWYKPPLSPIFGVEGVKTRENSSPIYP